jgi:hypothetical protein
MHAIRVENHMLDILHTCIEGEEMVPQQIVDKVLANLLESHERPAAYKLARTFLQRCATEMQKSLHSFLQGCLPTTISPSTDESELKDEWQTLLVELTAISPDTVTYILPQLEGVVTMEAEETRCAPSTAPLPWTHFCARYPAARPGVYCAVSRTPTRFESYADAMAQSFSASSSRSPAAMSPRSCPLCSRRLSSVA